MRITLPSLRLRLVAAAALAFLPLTALAMLVYHGHSILGQSRGYQFLSEPFSDLGRTSGYDGSNNALPHLLFATALTSIAVSFIVSLPVWGGYAFQRTRSLVTKATLTVFGVLSATCLAGIAFTPADTSDLHGTFVNFAFLSLIVFLGVLAGAQWKDPSMRKARWATAATCVVVILFFVDGSAAAHYAPVVGYVNGVVAQKILVYTCLLNLFVQARALAKRDMRFDVG